MSRRRVFRLPTSRGRIDDALREEFEFHLRERVEQFVAAGMSRDEATAEAGRRFGDFQAYREQVRHIDEETMRQRTFAETIDSMRREFGLAARSLLRTPTFSAITILTLALGLGATTAIFTLLDAVVLRPLPYRDADRLVRLSSPVPRMKGQTEWGIARHEMFYFLDKGRTLEALGVYQIGDATVMATRPGEQPERVRTAQASASLFNVLGFIPRAGRMILTQDNHGRQPTVVVLGHRYWQQRFGGDTAIVGRSIEIDGFPLRVVGVLSAGEELPEATIDLWLPAWVDSTTVWNNHTWQAIGRTRPGVTPADAERELVPLTARLPQEFQRCMANASSPTPGSPRRSSPCATPWWARC